MMSNDGSGLTRIAPIVFSLLVGGVGGYFVHYYGATSTTMVSTHSAGAGGGGTGGPPSGMGGGMGGGGMGRGMGGPPGGMGGRQASGAFALPRLVRNLAMIEKAKDQSLNAPQAQALLPILKQIQSADKLSDQDSQAKLADIEKILNESQKQLLQEMSPQGGGGRGGRGMGGPLGGMGGGGIGGGGQSDRPFASDRNKQALDDLIARLAHPA